MVVRMTAWYTLILVAPEISPVESAKSCPSFSEFGVHLIIHDNRLREDSAQVGQFFYHLQSLSVDGDVGLDLWFSRCWLVHHFCRFFMLMFRPKLSQATEILSTLFCMLALVVAFSAQSSANRNLLTMSVFTLIFA